MKFDRSSTLIRTAVIAAAMFGLAGCDSLRGKGGGGSPPAAFVPRPTAPNLLVVDGVIVLDQDPLVFGGRGSEKTIVWRLDPNGAYTFDPQAGISIEGANAKTEFTCRATGKHTFQCVNHHRVRGKYPYTIRLIDASGRPLTPVDPVIHNL